MSGALDVEKFHRLLLEERDRLKKEVAWVEHRDGDNPAGELGELSDDDTNHPGDMGTETYQRTQDMALRANDADLLCQVEQALLKIERGTYGLCDRCGDPIPVERLEILPYATFCMRCQDILEGTTSS